jgi:hypothetical protein
MSYWLEYRAGITILTESDAPFVKKPRQSRPPPPAARRTTAPTASTGPRGLSRRSHAQRDRLACRELRVRKARWHGTRRKRRRLTAHFIASRLSVNDYVAMGLELRRTLAIPRAHRSIRRRPLRSAATVTTRSRATCMTALAATAASHSPRAIDDHGYPKTGG